MNYRYLPLILITLTLQGEEPKATPSFQGFNGLVNTPNSEVLPEGTFEFLYSNQVDNFTPNSSTDFRDHKEQGSYFLNMGVLPNLDASLRYSHGINNLTNSDYLSDRIINVKYKLPFIPNDIASVALGIQDIGGRAPHLSSKYGVVSKTLGPIRTSLGYAKGTEEGALDGAFGSVEYQPLSWLQLGGEYDTREWNGVVKAAYPLKVSDQTVNLGVMAKSSLEYNDVYFGVYANMPLNDKGLPLGLSGHSANSTSFESLERLGLSNIVYHQEDGMVWFEYENTLYTWNDIDALGVVLGALATKHPDSNIFVTVKKANVARFTVKIESNPYQTFLKTGQAVPNLVTFEHYSYNKGGQTDSDWLKPTVTVAPDFILIDGSEYGHMDYTLALQTGMAMRLAKGTVLSGRYNAPVSMSDNFKLNGIFDYRNRNKTTSIIDQALISQYFQVDFPIPWMNVVQAGLFDKELAGVSFESAISDSSGRHLLMAKLAQLDDKLYQDMDLYWDKEQREERLLSYRYYYDRLNSDFKITGGEFLYGDRGVSFGFKRYFSDITLQLDLAHTKHDLRGTNNLGRLTLSIPFGPQKRLKTDYVDLKGGDITYTRYKTLVEKDNSSNIAQPHHLKEVTNDFTLEQYYLDKGRFHPAYIEANYNRLRNAYLREVE